VPAAVAGRGWHRSRSVASPGFAYGSERPQKEREAAVSDVSFSRIPGKLVPRGGAAWGSGRPTLARALGRMGVEVPARALFYSNTCPDVNRRAAWRSK